MYLRNTPKITVLYFFIYKLIGVFQQPFILFRIFKMFSDSINNVLSKKLCRPFCVRGKN